MYGRPPTVPAYTRSVAVVSVTGCIIGLGDRHLDNLPLDLSMGEVRTQGGLLVVFGGACA